MGGGISRLKIEIEKRCRGEREDTTGLEGSAGGEGNVDTSTPALH